MKTTTKWVNALAFDATADSGHTVRIDTSVKVGFTILEIEAEAEQTEEHPKVYKSIEMIYKVDAKEEDLDKVKRAVSLSQEKYCGVSAMLAKHCAINYTIQLI
jgi:putative redox protein